MTRVYLEPSFGHEDDHGDGGIRRVVEAQHRYLPGIEFVKGVEEADVVAVHIGPMAPTQRYLEKHPDVPYVVHLHGAYWGEYEWQNWALRANQLLMEAVRQADVVTAPSEWVAQTLRRNSLRPVPVIGHGIEMDEWPKRRGDRGYVLWNKTRLDAICEPESMQQLARLAPDVPFVTTYWPGRGSSAPENVTVTGRVGYEAAKEFVQEAAVYLCTARETFGIGTLEAMAAGAPIVGWAWGGQVSIVEHKRTGWLAKPGDMEGLLEGLRYCMDNRREMGDEARRVVEERYQWKNIAPAYEDLYSGLAKRAERKRPKVSVVVPAYGLEEHLPAALESVQQQTLEDWECIIVDDASPDGCGAIADEFAAKDTRYRVIHNEENQYLAGALNTGISAARSRYVLPLDADNMLPPRALATLAGELDKDRSMHIAYGNVLFVDADGKTPTIYGGRPGHGGWPMNFRADWQLLERNMLPSTSMYRREVWELLGGYRRRFRTAEDADFWTRATSYGFRPRMVTEADTLIYRNREESMSRVEKTPNWTAWYPWTTYGSMPPAAILTEPQVPIPSLEPVLVSIVIPVGPGHEELYIDALDSVAGSTFQLWECILVNDTGQPLRWVPSWAHLVETKGKIGVAAARNAGLSIAKGNLFVPLDADDTLEPLGLAQMYEGWEKFGGYVYPDWFEMRDGELKVWETPEYVPEELLSRGCLHAVTALYPMEAWRELGGFDETLSAWEDWDWMLKLANAGYCGTRMPVPGFVYRKDTGTRREENFAAFDASKAGILTKWKPFFEQREELMACSGCRKGGGGRAAAPVRRPEPAAVSAPNDGKFIYVEYVGPRTGASRYRGPSGQRYRFANTASERTKLVKVEDAAFFESLQDFRVRRAEAPVA